MHSTPAGIAVRTAARIVMLAGLALLMSALPAAPAFAMQLRLLDTNDPEVTEALAAAVADIDALSEPPSAEIEEARLNSLVRAFGYLAAEVGISPTQQSDLFYVDVQLGPLFRLGAIQIVGLADAGADALALDLQTRLQQVIGQPARASVLSSLGDELRWRIQQASYPLARIIGTRLDIERRTQTASASFMIAPGPQASFGAVTFKGARSTTSAELQALVPFRAGAPFNPAQLDLLRASLLKLPRVRSISVSLDDEIGSDGTIPIEVSLDQYQDPALLSDNKIAGIAALAGALIVLVVRELVLRFHKGTRIRFLLNSGLVAVLAAGMLVSTYRAWLFIQLG